MKLWQKPPRCLSRASENPFKFLYFIDSRIRGSDSELSPFQFCNRLNIPQHLIESNENKMSPRCAHGEGQSIFDRITRRGKSA